MTDKIEIELGSRPRRFLRLFAVNKLSTFSFVAAGLAAVLLMGCLVLPLLPRESQHDIKQYYDPIGLGIFFLGSTALWVSGAGALLGVLALCFRNRRSFATTALVANLALFAVPWAVVAIRQYQWRYQQRELLALPENRLLNALGRHPFDRQAALEALADGAKVEGPDGRLLAHIAMNRGTSAEAVTFLIEQGADVNAVDPWEGTALHAAVEHGAAAVVETLLRHGADPTVRTRDGLTALELALRRPDFPLERVRELLGGNPPHAGPRGAEDDGDEAAEATSAPSSAPRRLVPGGWKASWSPDGRRLVFATPGRDAIEMLHLRTSVRTTLVAPGKDPDWSPDGRHIAFVREPSHDAYAAESVWLCVPDDPEHRRVVAGGFPSWSGDGKTLYVHDRVRNQVLAIRVDDAELKPTVFFDRALSWYPAVSPDGSRIAFGTWGQLQVVDRASRETVLAWPTPGNRGILPAWSPDGKLLAFGGFDDSTLGVWVIDVPAKRAVSVLVGHYTMPAWSKDGSLLAFDLREADRREVWVVSREWVEARLSVSRPLHEEAFDGKGLRGGPR